MLLTLLKSKLHSATVTGAELHYEGSIGIDKTLIEAAGFLLHERVEIYNITNGVRFATYVIEDEAGSGKVTLNGAAARLVQKGDKIIIATYCIMNEQEARAHRPKVVLLGEDNRIKRVEE